MAFLEKNIHKIITFLFFFSFFILTSVAQTKYIHKNVSLKVKLITHKLKKYDLVTGPRIGKSASISDQYIIFEKLELKANENELYELTNHPNSTVRAYAFYGLVNKNSSRVLEVIEKNKSDTIIINQQFGCLRAKNTVIGFMDKFVKSYIEKNKTELTAGQKNLLDKISEDQMEWWDRRINEETEEK